ncbi:hypothetical protein MTY_1963 [Moorella thermoacetica Y72]|uniref:Uncharacterized protein n=1 Tax=Moorella thermoacetica Y72 TaxID=1325331 RepID=A0A0S6UDU1_NEOTH|nr:hypothetical protein [Moorella thermoacetica]GAF26623.1 hypothetical protein MTY_1963 [Moorella thermoacetica Y72]
MKTAAAIAQGMRTAARNSKQPRLLGQGLERIEGSYSMESPWFEEHFRINDLEFP